MTDEQQIPDEAMAGLEDRMPESSQGLPDPGLPIVLVLTTRTDGKSDINYLGDPEWAVQTLRSVADQIEKEVLI